MTDIGTVYPPRDAWDIAAYPIDDVVDGYRDYSADVISPGSNRAPGYRWGWLCRRADATGEPDGYEGIRLAYLHMSERPN